MEGIDNMQRRDRTVAEKVAQSCDCHLMANPKDCDAKGSFTNQGNWKLPPFQRERVYWPSYPLKRMPPSNVIMNNEFHDHEAFPLIARSQVPLQWNLRATDIVFQDCLENVFSQSE